MTKQSRSTLSTLAQVAALLAIGLGALIAYTRASYVPREAYAQAHAAVVAEVADVRTCAAGTTEQLKGDVKEIRAQLGAQGKQLDRIERLVERLSQPAPVAPAQHRTGP